MHELAHWLGLVGYEFVAIVHEPHCPGLCFVTPGMKQCNWKVTICCRTCGKVKVIE